jgi:hypothetical protein
MPSMRTRNRWQLALFAGIGGIVLSSACGSGSNPDTLGGTNGLDSGTVPQSCATPHPGCPCSSKGQSVACGEVVTHDPDGVTCGEGESICDGTTWGTCQISSMMFKSLHPVSAGGGSGSFHLLDLTVDASADAGGCSVCDPTCQGFVDNSNGVDAGSGLVPTDGGGWTLPVGTNDGGGCQGLQCQVPTCPSGETTAITGTVWDPAAINPVFNAVVMIPNATVQPVPAGVSNDPCGGASLPPAVTYAYSDTSGHFTLTGVPVAASVPLVIQIGRWRRVATINTSALTCVNPSTGATNISSAGGCADPHPGLNAYNATVNCPTRLPRVQGDGNIPHIAIATGGLDAIECMLYRMGVSSSEYTDENGTGRINIFNDGGSVLAAPAANHDLSYLLGFTCPSSKCPSGSVVSSTTTNITNPSFENALTGWTTSGASVTSSNVTAHAGTYSARLGSTSPTNGDSSVTQTITAPAGINGLQFWADIECNDGVTWDWFTATMTDNTAGGTQTIAHTCPFGNTSWSSYSFAATPGHSYTLKLTNHDDDWPSDPTWTYVDDVSWVNYAAPASQLNNYDLVMLPCDGGGEYNSSNWGTDQDDPGRENLVSYAGVGGRIFTSHWGREWIERASTAIPNGPFVLTTSDPATWISDQSGNSTTGVINTGPTYGQNFDAWMKAVGATANTNITINPWREDTSAVSTTDPSARLFVTFNGSNGTTNGYPADFTFDTPLGSSSPVGRVMFTDMHLANGTPSGTFPGNCPTQGTALLQQEDAAEYLLFDLGACVSGLPIPMPAQQYNPSTFTRDYNAVCPAGYRPRWRWFQWADTTPSDSNIVFQAWTADTEAQLGTEFTPPLPASLWTSTTANPGPANPVPAPNPPYAVDVDPALVAAGVPTWNASVSPPATPKAGSYAWLRVAMTLNPSSDKKSAPTLLAWQQNYDCVSSE